MLNSFSSEVDHSESIACVAGVSRERHARERLDCFRLLAVLQACCAGEYVTCEAIKRASEGNARGRRCNGFAHAAIPRPRDCWKSKEHSALAGLIPNFPFNHLPHQTKENTVQSVILYILS